MNPKLTALFPELTPREAHALGTGTMDFATGSGAFPPAAFYAG